MDSSQKDDKVQGSSAQANNKTPLWPISDFLEKNYFLDYKKVYKVYECLIAALYMHYRDPNSEEGQIALKRIEVLLLVLPNSEKLTKKDNFAGKYFEISSFLSDEKDEWYWKEKNPLGQFKLPVFDNFGWLEVPGDSILWQTYEQIRSELEGDFERLKRLENKIRYIYINRLINNLLDKNHFDIEITLEQLEELGLPKIPKRKNEMDDENW